MFEIIENQQTLVDLDIPFGTGSVSGQIISPYLDDSRSWLLLRSAGQELTAEIRPDAKGNYTVANLPPGDYIIGKSSVTNSRESTLKEFHLDPDEQRLGLSLAAGE